MQAFFCASSGQLELADASVAGGGLYPASCSEIPKPSSALNLLFQVVALDCEMVGVGPDGERSALAR